MKTGLARFGEPSDFEWGRFDNNKGASIRYGHAAPKGTPRATVVLLTGLNESIEKYFETTHELLAQGYDVWLMDWRGQGKSERYLKDNPQKAHSEGYQEQIDTLHQFTQQIVQDEGRPMFMMAQSMGAHIGLRYLHDYKDVFDAAMLTSPMIDVLTPGLSRGHAELLAAWSHTNDFSKEYVLGIAGDWHESQYRFEDNNKTSDRERFQAYVDRCKEDEEMRLGAPTNDWYYHTFESIRVLNDENYLKSIRTPILMQLPSGETVVDPEAQQRAASLLPNCSKIDIHGAKHSLWIEKDEYRNEWIGNVRDYMEEHLKMRSPMQKRAPKAQPEAPQH